jgi:hypothetical protein
MKNLCKITLLVLAGGALTGGALVSGAGLTHANGVALNDNLNATLWTQSSVEFKANASMPNAPALLTAAANSGVANGLIGAWTMGYVRSSVSFSRVVRLRSSIPPISNNP